MAQLPSITIVTPSFNQAPFLEETIRSVLAQDYSDLDYVVVDGGSDDGSAAIIEHYRPWLSAAIIEPDRGQSDAINKGWRLATGRYFGWVNSDDFLLPGALLAAAHTCAEAPVPPAAIAGGGIVVDESSRTIRETVPHHLDGEHLVRFWEGGFSFLQAAMLFRRDDRNRGADFVDSSLRYVMDYDLLCRILREEAVVYVHRKLAAYRTHAAAKSIDQSQPMFLELSAASRRYWSAYGVGEADRMEHDRHVAATLLQGVLSHLRRGRVRDALRTASYLAGSPGRAIAWAAARRVLGRPSQRR